MKATFCLLSNLNHVPIPLWMSFLCINSTPVVLSFDPKEEERKKKPQIPENAASNPKTDFNSIKVQTSQFDLSRVRVWYLRFLSLLNPPFFYWGIFACSSRFFFGWFWWGRVLVPLFLLTKDVFLHAGFVYTLRSEADGSYSSS